MPFEFPAGNDMKHLIGILVVILGVFLAPLAAAEDYIVSRAVLEDEDGSLSIAEAANSKFTPIGPTLSEGYSDSAYWLRLKIRRPAHSSQVMLQISSAFLDDVRLYEAVDGKPLEWITRKTGDQYAYDERDQIAIAPGFAINVTTAEKTYYLRIQTTSPSLTNVVALEPHEAQRQQLRSDLVRNIFMGLMLWACVWAIDHYLVDRQKVIGLFGVYQAVYILYGLSSTGNFAPLISPTFPLLADWMTTILACCIPFFFLLFSRALFKLYAPPAALMRGFIPLLLVLPVQFAAMALDYTRLALSIGDLVALAAIWYCVIVAFSTRQEQVPSRRWLQGVYIVLALLTTEAIFANCGWMTVTQASAQTEWTLIVHGIVSSSLIIMLLYRHLRQLRLDAQGSALALALSQQALELERAHKESAQLHARTDYLTGVFNRRHFTELVERELAKAIRYRQPLSLLMIDIDHFKSVNDTWGHHSGDIVLQKVAHLIRDTLREVDILARMGGEEFAAVLVETNTEQAMEVAQRLRTAIAASAIDLPAGQPVQITVSIGLARLAGQDNTLENLLRKADQALYRAKQSGRNNVVASN